MARFFGVTSAVLFALCLMIYAVLAFSNLSGKMLIEIWSLLCVGMFCSLLAVNCVAISHKNGKLALYFWLPLIIGAILAILMASSDFFDTLLRFLLFKNPDRLFVVVVISMFFWLYKIFKILGEISGDSKFLLCFINAILSGVVFYFSLVNDQIIVVFCGLALIVASLIFYFLGWRNFS